MITRCPSCPGGLWPLRCGAVAPWWRLQPYVHAPGILKRSALSRVPASLERRSGPFSCPASVLSHPCSRGGGAPALARPSEDLARALKVSTLQAAAKANGSLRGSFYDPDASAADVAAAAASTAAAAAVQRALSDGPGSFRQSGAGSFRRAGGSFRNPADGSSVAGADGDEEEVQLVFSQDQAGTDLDALFPGSLARSSAPGGAAKPSSQGSMRGSEAEAGNRGGEGRAPDALAPLEAQRQLAASAGAAASQAAAALVRRQISRAAAGRAAATGIGSTRDLLGRLQSTTPGNTRCEAEGVGGDWHRQLPATDRVEQLEPAVCGASLRKRWPAYLCSAAGPKVGTCP